MSALLNPTYMEVKKWGALAYVNEAERKRIMDSPHGESAREITRLERRIAEAKKKKQLK